jgi:hypothetical protein
VRKWICAPKRPEGIRWNTNRWKPYSMPLHAAYPATNVKSAKETKTYPPETSSCLEIPPLSLHPSAIETSATGTHVAGTRYHGDLEKNSSVAFWKNRSDDRSSYDRVGGFCCFAASEDTADSGSYTHAAYAPRAPSAPTCANSGLRRSAPDPNEHLVVVSNASPRGFGLHGSSSKDSSREASSSEPTDDGARSISVSGDSVREPR